jgi:hypothetical protein
MEYKCSYLGLHFQTSPFFYQHEAREDVYHHQTKAGNKEECYFSSKKWETNRELTR